MLPPYSPPFSRRVPSSRCDLHPLRRLHVGDSSSEFGGIPETRTSRIRINLALQLSKGLLWTLESACPFYSRSDDVSADLPNRQLLFRSKVCNGNPATLGQTLNLIHHDGTNAPSHGLAAGRELLASVYTSRQLILFWKKFSKVGWNALNCT